MNLMKLSENPHRKAHELRAMHSLPTAVVGLPIQECQITKIGISLNLPQPNEFFLKCHVV